MFNCKWQPLPAPEDPSQPSMVFTPLSIPPFPGDRNLVMGGAIKKNQENIFKGFHFFEMVV